MERRVMWTLLHRREDGTFVISLQTDQGALPYHVVQGDPLYPAVAEAAEGVVLPPEPPPRQWRHAGKFSP